MNQNEAHIDGAEQSDLNAELELKRSDSKEIRTLIDEPDLDAKKYAKGSVWYVTFGRMPALIITFCIELIPAFVIASGSHKLDKYLTSDESSVLKF